MRRKKVIGLVLAGALGIASPWILVDLLGLASGKLWIPFVRYLWTSHGTATRDLPVNLSIVLDGVVGAAVGFALALLVASLSEESYLLRGTTFIICFLLSAILPATLAGQYDLVTFFLLTPGVVVFVCVAVGTFWLRSRRPIVRNVA